MERTTTGTVLSVSRQWWLKVNTKAFRAGPMDGAIFPHVIRAEYTVAGESFRRIKWIGAGKPVPAVGDTVRVRYRVDKPDRARIL